MGNESSRPPPPPLFVVESGGELSPPPTPAQCMACGKQALRDAMIKQGPMSHGASVSNANSNGNQALIMVILLLVVAGALGYYVFMKKKE